MRQKLLNIIALLALALLPVWGLTGTAAAACGSATSSKGQVLQGIGQTGNDCSGSGVTDVISVAVTILSIVVGIAAVIMIMVSGLKYITSGGDSNKVSSAKSTLIYALIGIAVAALAQLLVHYAINAPTKATAPCATDSSKLATDPTCHT
jgi:uncharacterized membrane protein YuzA (DUF378 family)